MPASTRTERPARLSSPRRRRRLAGNGDAGTELLGLDNGPIGELTARDAGGEAEVILDARRRAGLTAGGDCVDHHGGEPFRCAVDRGCKTRGPRPDDDEVPDTPA